MIHKTFCMAWIKINITLNDKRATVSESVSVLQWNARCGERELICVRVSPTLNGPTHGRSHVVANQPHLIQCHMKPTSLAPMCIDCKPNPLARCVLALLADTDTDVDVVCLIIKQKKTKLWSDLCDNRITPCPICRWHDKKSLIQIIDHRLKQIILKLK